MIALTWLAGLVRRRRARLVGTAAGVALAVALLGSLGAFLTGARSTMTARAIARVAVDWQVEAQPSAAGPTDIVTAVRQDRHVGTALPVEFGASTGLDAQSGGTTQTTGPAVVVGFPDRYISTFPGVIRLLAGSNRGVLLAQQTAANLHAGPGDTVRVGRAGLPPAAVVVDGIVDLPQADSLFQTVGATPGAQPKAPPDNVILLPASVWQTTFEPLATTRPDLVRHQAHARLHHTLPHDPAAALTAVGGAAHNLEARLAGAGLVGDNLAAALGAARADALYAQVLFLLLGFPGAVLAGLLTRTLAGAGADRRRRELALLRARGATTTALSRLASAEALAVALVGGALGMGIAALVGRSAFGYASFGSTRTSSAIWAAGALVVGLVVAVVSIAVPAWRDARALTVSAARAAIGERPRPLALRVGLDFWLLAGAGLIFWMTTRSQYRLVLAPEGVPTVSVNYWSLAAPLLLWAGAGLAAWRATDAMLRRGRRVVRGMVRPIARGLTGPVAATIRRQGRPLATSIVVLGLTIAFALSTATFNATYRQQAGADALLTNGADVTVTQPPGTSLPPTTIAALAHVSGVRHVEAVKHRFVYIGADLQDIYGIDPNTVVGATSLQDAYFSGGSARALMDMLRRHPDAALFSAETVHDFQLQPGDLLRLRLREPRSGQLVEVPVHYAGIVKEFPTAPTDSFVVANAAYLSARTGDSSPDTLLLDTTGHPRTVAAEVRKLVGPTSTVTDIETSRKIIGSSLTAVDLRGLTRVELGYALVLAIGAAGLVLALGLAERRRSFAIATALGARRRQIGAFVWSEAMLIGVSGLVVGAITGWTLAHVLVRVLKEVFDPPPAHLAVPWAYLTVVGVLTVAAIAAAAAGTVRASRKPAIELIRDL